MRTVQGFRLVITGGRDYWDRAALWEVLDATHALLPIAFLGHGGATGADTLADRWAKARGVMRQDYPADWRRWGRRMAGGIRNRQMLLRVQPHLVYAFPGGSGTADCVAAARELGFVVFDLRSRLAA